MHYRSWGYKPATDQYAIKPAWKEDINLLSNEVGITSMLAYGNGRSYGDSCLNSSGILIDTCLLDKFIAFDKVTGTLQVESGVKLQDILSLVVPHGWFLPVVPGTSMVTVGGAIANDVHGKNHHCDGTFGCHVESFVLLRSDGTQYTCSWEENNEWYCATIGGLGLTGLIVQVTLKLKAISSSDMQVYVQRFHGLNEFCALSEELSKSHAYSVAWLDCVSSDKKFARGVFLAANHAETGELLAANTNLKLAVPFDFPSITLNQLTVKAFNELYFKRHATLSGNTIRQNYGQYFFPLDSVKGWNRIYGSHGFYQYQFVVPHSQLEALESIIEEITYSGIGSFLAVLKEFGNIASPGLLSFPRSGYCLALDFAHRKTKTKLLLESLDRKVREVGGAVYPAKDRLMSSEAFKQYFPRHDEFSSWVDERFSSDFWKRVYGK